MKETVFSDFAKICKPSENVTERRIMNKWCVEPFETEKISGTMLMAPHRSKPEDISFSPNLKGWYKIYVGLFGGYDRNCMIDLKISGDITFRHLGNSINTMQYGEHFIEDVFWRCANMTGKDIFIGKHCSYASSCDATLSWVRFVHMSEDEVKAYKADKARKDTKRLYTTCDIQCMPVAYDMVDDNMWYNFIDEMSDSDAEWMSFESLLCYNGKMKEIPPCEIAYTYDYDMYGAIYDCIQKIRSDENFNKRLVDYAHKIGVKAAISLRLCMWGMEYPYDKIYYESDFTKLHPEWRCIDRDGDVTDMMSFAYPQVQDYVIDMFVKMSECGCDAVQPLFSRGWPFVLFEQPFVERFMNKYGCDPCVLPLDDERIIDVKCEIMTEFMRKLRIKLNEVRKDRPVELHAKVLFSMYDNKLVGLDLEEWAKEGLVDLIVSDERRIRERLCDCVWVDDDKKQIDLKKYKAFARSYPDPIIIYDYDYIFEPTADSKGILRGPKNQNMRICEFMELEKKYGMKVYIEIMPREMAPNEIKRKAQEIYDAGCEHIGLWDTYSRYFRKREWAMWSRIGHKDDIASLNEEGMFKKVKLIKLSGKNLRSYQGMWSG